MIYRFFKSYHPTVIISILVIGVAFFLKPLIHFSGYSGSEMVLAMPLMEVFSKIIGTNTLLILCTSIVFLLAQAYYLVRLNLNYYFIEERTYLPALLYLLFSGIIYTISGFQTEIIAVFFLLVVVDKILNTPNISNKLSGYYDMGLLLGTGSLFTGSLLFYGFFIIFGLVIVNTLDLRKTIILILGILTIYFITWFFYFFNDSQRLFIDILKSNFSARDTVVQFHYSIVVLLGFLGFILILSAGALLVRFNKKKIIARKYFSVIILLFVFSLAGYFLIPVFSIGTAYIIAISLSFLFADFFVHLRTKWFREIIFLLLILVSIFILIVYPI